MMKSVIVSVVLFAICLPSNRARSNYGNGYGAMKPSASHPHALQYAQMPVVNDVSLVGGELSSMGLEMADVAARRFGFGRNKNRRPGHKHRPRPGHKHRPRPGHKHRPRPHHEDADMGGDDVAAAPPAGPGFWQGTQDVIGGIANTAQNVNILQGSITDIYQKYWGSGDPNAPPPDDGGGDGDDEQPEDGDESGDTSDGQTPDQNGGGAGK